MISSVPKDHRASSIAKSTEKKAVFILICHLKARQQKSLKPAMINCKKTAVLSINKVDFKEIKT